MGVNNRIQGYKKCMPDNALELVVLNSNLNRDAHCTANKHVTCTATLPKSDVHKFSIAKPKEMDCTYL
eukprot:14641584-Ditylum_brightwellii.AAC.1